MDVDSGRRDSGSSKRGIQSVDDFDESNGPLRHRRRIDFSGKENNSQRNTSEIVDFERKLIHIEGNAKEKSLATRFPSKIGKIVTKMFWTKEVDVEFVYFSSFLCSCCGLKLNKAFGCNLSTLVKKLSPTEIGCFCLGIVGKKNKYKLVRNVLGRVCEICVNKRVTAIARRKKKMVDSECLTLMDQVRALKRKGKVLERELKWKKVENDFRSNSFLQKIVSEFQANCRLYMGKDLANTFLNARKHSLKREDGKKGKLTLWIILKLFVIRKDDEYELSDRNQQKQLLRAHVIFELFCKLLNPSFKSKFDVVFSAVLTSFIDSDMAQAFGNIMGNGYSPSGFTSLLRNEAKKSGKVVTPANTPKADCTAVGTFDNINKNIKSTRKSSDHKNKTKVFCNCGIFKNNLKIEDFNKLKHRFENEEVKKITFEDCYLKNDRMETEFFQRQRFDRLKSVVNKERKESSSGNIVADYDENCKRIEKKFCVACDCFYETKKVNCDSCGFKLPRVEGKTRQRMGKLHQEVLKKAQLVEAAVGPQQVIRSTYQNTNTKIYVTKGVKKDPSSLENILFILKFMMGGMRGVGMKSFPFVVDGLISSKIINEWIEDKAFMKDVIPIIGLFHSTQEFTKLVLKLIDKFDSQLLHALGFTSPELRKWICGCGDFHKSFDCPDVLFDVLGKELIFKAQEKEKKLEVEFSEVKKLFKDHVLFELWELIGTLLCLKDGIRKGDHGRIKRSLKNLDPLLYMSNHVHYCRIRTFEVLREVYYIDNGQGVLAKFIDDCSILVNKDGVSFESTDGKWEFKNKELKRVCPGNKLEDWESGSVCFEDLVALRQCLFDALGLVDKLRVKKVTTHFIDDMKARRRIREKFDEYFFSWVTKDENGEEVKGKGFISFFEVLSKRMKWYFQEFQNSVVDGERMSLDTKHVEKFRFDTITNENNILIEEDDADFVLSPEAQKLLRELDHVEEERKPEDLSVFHISSSQDTVFLTRNECKKITNNGGVCVCTCSKTIKGWKNVGKCQACDKLFFHGSCGIVTTAKWSELGRNFSDKLIHFCATCLEEYQCKICKKALKVSDKLFFSIKHKQICCCERMEDDEEEGEDQTESMTESVVTRPLSLEESDTRTTNLIDETTTSQTPISVSVLDPSLKERSNGDLRTTNINLYKVDDENECPNCKAKGVDVYRCIYGCQSDYDQCTKCNGFFCRGKNGDGCGYLGEQLFSEWVEPCCYHCWFDCNDNCN